MNERKLTKDELRQIAKAIANGGSTIDIAAELGVDRSTMSGWLKRDQFLDMVAKSLSSPDDLGADALANLRDERLHDGERSAAYALRRDFAAALEAAHAEYFEAVEDDEIANEICAEADRKYNIETLIEIEERNWRDGSADELAKGLDTPEKRRANRCEHGIKWDFGPLGCYYQEKWDATRCRVRYADEEDHMSWEEQRATFGWCWHDRYDIFHKEADVVAVNTRPLDVARDPRLPTIPEHARKLLEKVKSGMSFSDAVAQCREELQKELEELREKGKRWLEELKML